MPARSGSVFSRCPAWSPREVNKRIGSRLSPVARIQTIFSLILRPFWWRGFRRLQGAALSFALREALDRAVSQDESRFGLPDGARALESD
jgi:hypothetical protein